MKFFIAAIVIALLSSCSYSSLKTGDGERTGNISGVNITNEHDVDVNAKVKQLMATRLILRAANRSNPLRRSSQKTANSLPTSTELSQFVSVLYRTSCFCKNTLMMTTTGTSFWT
jgi:hypothetical protein